MARSHTDPRISGVTSSETLLLPNKAPERSAAIELELPKPSIEHLTNFQPAVLGPERQQSKLSEAELNHVARVVQLAGATLNALDSAHRASQQNLPITLEKVVRSMPGGTWNLELGEGIAKTIDDQVLRPLRDLRQQIGERLGAEAAAADPATKLLDKVIKNVESSTASLEQGGRHLPLSACHELRSLADCALNPLSHFADNLRLELGPDKPLLAREVISIRFQELRELQRNGWVPEGLSHADVVARAVAIATALRESGPTAPRTPPARSELQRMEAEHTSRMLQLTALLLRAAEDPRARQLLLSDKTVISQVPELQAVMKFSGTENEQSQQICSWMKQNLLPSLERLESRLRQSSKSASDPVQECLSNVNSFLTLQFRVAVQDHALGKPNATINGSFEGVSRFIQNMNNRLGVRRDLDSPIPIDEKQLGSLKQMRFVAAGVSVEQVNQRAEAISHSLRLMSGKIEKSAGPVPSMPPDLAERTPRIGKNLLKAIFLERE